MMLSINIPVYNIEVHDLVLQLVKQAQTEAIDFEIRIYDDGSAEAMKNRNRQLAGTPHILYLEMEHNLGRAAIRNRMGFDAKGTYLLFIDADSKLISRNYLKKYVEHASPGIVLCGGTAYSSEKPAGEKMLRWIYGRKREAIPAIERTSRKGFIITSNNFLIDRELFKEIHFREIPGPYGHEDTLLGYDLFSAGIMPQHIDNPMEHTGLEDSKTFLTKTREAMENLHYISANTLAHAPEFQNQINFLKQYRKVTGIIPPFLIRWTFRLFSSVIEKKLTGGNPRLFLFDAYKLGYFAQLKANEHR
jgi:glycosyltransferase involved in cell wall biosynthesis